MIVKILIAAGVALALSTTASAQISDAGDPEAFAEELRGAEPDPSTSAGADPWEGFNRKMFAFNDAVDTGVFVPAAKAYRATTHKKQRKGIRNFLANARTPVIFINDMLQGEFKRAGETAGRFFVNTTIGFGGMGDPAERMGIPQHSEDFGQTLAVWGTPTGPYVVLPFFGPSSVRDGLGAGVDTTIDPVFWLNTSAARYTGYSRAGITLVSVREPLIEPLADIKKNSLDYYASFRSFYMQARKREIANGRANFDDLPDIGEFEEFDDLE